MEFKTLFVYSKARELYQLINEQIISSGSLDRITKDQLRRASLSIVLNIAEGTSRITNADRRHFFVTARGSAYECYVIIDLLNNFEKELLKLILDKLEEISKMLFALIRKLQ